MSISEAERHEIYELIKAATSDRVANNGMSMFPPVGWADVAIKSDIESLRSEVGSVRSEIGALRTEMRTEFGSVRADLGSVRTETRSEFASVRAVTRSEFGSVRADMRTLDANLRTEMHQSIRSQTWALVAWTTALAGLIVALGRSPPRGLRRG